MHLWHLELDTPRRPAEVEPGEPVVAAVGTWPVEQGQSVWAAIDVRGATGRRRQEVRKGRWCRNEGPNSYWEIDLGRFDAGDTVRYQVLGESEPGAVVTTAHFELRIPGEPAAISERVLPVAARV